MQPTTIMRNSIVGDAWIQESCRQNPVSKVLDANGAWTGNITTGPVRLAFTDSLFEKKPKMKSDPNSALSHSCVLLFTPYSDLAIFWEEYYRICAQDFAAFYNPNANPPGYAVDNPLFDQNLKTQYTGFTPGCMATTISSQYKPPIVDVRENPITDPAQIYAGVWAIASVNAYASGKGKPKKGPRFGIQAIMKIGDDTPLAGGAADPKQQFKGVTVKPPAAAPSSAFGQPMAPPPGGTQTFYPPPQGMAPPPVAGHVAAFTPTYLPPPPPGQADDMSEFM